MAGSHVKADLWVNEYMTPWDIYSHGITKVLATASTPFQEMQIVETGVYGRALVLDGKWQSCTGDEFLYHEPLVHPAMIAHRAPKDVLILGGGEGATSREVLKWSCVENVTMIDIDGEVVAACREHLSEMHQGAFSDPRHEVLIEDGMKFLDETDQSWDVVISDLSDPIEDGPSFQFFTREYFEKVKGLLRENGVFVVQSGPVSPPGIEMHAKLHRTMSAVFPSVRSHSSHVPTYCAPWSYILGSDIDLPTRPEPDEVDQLLRQKVSGELRMFDGTTLLGMLQLPAHVRRAIEAETEIYTLTSPPKFFGKGVAKEVETTAT